MTSPKTAPARAPRKAAKAAKPSQRTEPAEPAGPPAGSMELVHVDPGSLIVGPNVRVDPRLDAEFLASIRDRGVLQPILARRVGDGLEVVMGQRRTVAAVQVGRATVPVVVMPAPDDEIDRITDQVVENAHRAGLTRAEELGAYEQLVAFGVPAATIVKKMSRPRAEVDRALRVVASKAARAAVEQYDLGIDEAVAFAEFEGDEHAEKCLRETMAMGGGRLPHVVQGLRDGVAGRAAVAAKVAELEAAGVKVIPEPKRDDETVLPISRLRDPDGKRYTTSGEDLASGELHKDCPGHAAYVDYYRDEDPDDEDEDSPPPLVVEVSYFCVGWQEHGHLDRYASSSSTPKLADLPEDQQEAARAERREKLSNNRAWRSATTVRREWLTTFLQRKTPPKSASVFVASAYARRADGLSYAAERGNTLARELLGVPYEQPAWNLPRDPDDETRRLALETMVGAASEARAQVILLGIVLGAVESQCDERVWQHPRDESIRYLRALQEWGYPLSEIEEQACRRQEQQAARRREAEAGERPWEEVHDSPEESP